MLPLRRCAGKVDDSTRIIRGVSGRFDRVFWAWNAFWNTLEKSHPPARCHKSKNVCRFKCFRGAGDRTRTGDILLGRQTLYQLSYSRTGVLASDSIGRGERTRTSDLSVPNAARYQAAPHPAVVRANREYREHPRVRQSELPTTSNILANCGVLATPRNHVNGFRRLDLTSRRYASETGTKGKKSGTKGAH